MVKKKIVDARGVKKKMKEKKIYLYFGFSEKEKKIR